MKKNNYNIREMVKANRWIILASIFFVVWKFALISILWNGRVIPPSPDDSFIYILHIDSVIKCNSLVSCDNSLFTFNNYSGFEHLSYRLFFGVIGKIFSLSAETVYYLSFFIGTVLLVPVLILFLHSINSDKRLIAISLFVLALYNGSGSYHGFFWVVPSFFAFLSFLLILSIILDESVRHWKLILLFLIPVSLQIHTLSIYFITTLPIFFLFYCIFSKTIDKKILAKVVFTVIVSLISYSAVSYYLERVSTGNPYGIETFSVEALQNYTEAAKQTASVSHNPSLLMRLQNFLPSISGWEDIVNNYFKWIFPHWIFFIAFAVCFGILFYNKQHKLLALYCSALALTFASSININGVRSLIFIWPITFIIYAYSAWFFYQFLIKKVVNKGTSFLLRSAFFLFCILFVLINLGYSFFENYSEGEHRNIQVDRIVLSHIVKQVSGSRVYLSDDLDFFNPMSQLYGFKPLNQTTNLTLANYYITTEKHANKVNPLLDEFINVVSKITGFRRQSINENSTVDTSEETISKSSRKSYGDITVYTLPTQ